MPGEWRAADISTLRQIEAAGGAFADERGQPVDLITLLSQRGFNAVRLRVWVDPAGGACGLGQTLEMAQRVHDAGLLLIVDLHYSDSWADPGQQTIPGAWAGQNVVQLGETVETYTRGVLQALINQGTPAAGVQIGNEITSGMLWPAGRIGGSFEGNWAAFLSLVEAGCRGARSVTPAPLVVLHIDRGGDNGGTRWFFDRVAAAGITFDVIGLSYYPWWHGSLQAMSANVQDVAGRYGKRVWLAETGYPWTLQWSDNTQNIVGLPGQVLAGYPASPIGQKRFLRDVMQSVRNVPMGLGMGAAYWEPGLCAFAGFGSWYENVTLFDFAHRTLPAMAAWTCCAGDFNLDGTLDFFDYLDFVVEFSTGTTAADFNADGVVDFFDYLDFVAGFSAGC
jgi:arabinogalactan endo-1,4-beta-galactosidase